MQKNVGKTDRVIRIILGVALLGLGSAWPCWICAILGLILIITGILQKCPAYNLLNINTVKAKQ